MEPVPAKKVYPLIIFVFLSAEGDLYEDGLAMKNGFFRTRRFAQTSEAGSLELFTEDRDSGGEGEETSHQTEAKRRRDRLEKEEFIRKCKVREGGRRKGRE